MLEAILLFFVGLFVQAGSAEYGSPPATTCTYGCVAYGESSLYEITREDVTTIALLAKAESGPRFVARESAATVWAMVQRFAFLNLRRGASDPISLTGLMRSYSAVLSTKYRSDEGTVYHSRITPRADAYADIVWFDVPAVWRRFAASFIEGEVLDPLPPGCVHVLARGFEEQAADGLIGPFYASTAEEHPGGNAYYQVEATRHWSPGTVRVIPATAQFISLSSARSTSR